MENFRWANGVASEEVRVILYRAKEERNALQTVKGRNAVLVTYCIGNAVLNAVI